MPSVARLLPGWSTPPDCWPSPTCSWPCCGTDIRCGSAPVAEPHRVPAVPGSALQQGLADIALRVGDSRWNHEHRGPDGSGPGVQGVEFGETTLHRQILRRDIALVGGEQQP